MRPVEVRNRGGWVEMQGFDAGVAGLVIVRDDKDEWSLVHERSGLRMCYSHNPEALGAVVTRLANLADWTSQGAILRASVEASFSRSVAEVPGVRRARGMACQEALQR